MPAAIRFSSGAYQDLSDAIDFLGATSPAAERFAESIDRAIVRLMDYPESGTPRDGGERALYVYGTAYSIIYELNEGRLRILAFAHTSRRAGYWREHG